MRRHFSIGWNYHHTAVSRERHFIAPTPMREIDFKRLCEDLVPDAGKRAMAKYQGQMYPIGWVEIIEALCALLVERGFEEFLPESVSFKGSWTITDNYPPMKDDALLGEVRKEIAHFNDNTLWDCNYAQAVS